MKIITLDALMRTKLIVDNPFDFPLDQVVALYHNLTGSNTARKEQFKTHALFTAVNAIPIDEWEGAEIVLSDADSEDTDFEYDDFGDYELSDESEVSSEEPSEDEDMSDGYSDDSWDLSV